MRSKLIPYAVGIIFLGSFVFAVTDWGFYDFNADLLDTGLNNNRYHLNGDNHGFVAGKQGNALNLSQDISSGVWNNSITNASSLRSFNFWFKPVSITHGDLLFYLAEDNTNYIVVVNELNKLRAYFSIGGKVWDLTGTSNPFFEIDRWHNIELRLNDSGAYLFGNGTLEANSTVTTKFPSTFNNMSLGMLLEGSAFNSAGADGLFDNLSISTDASTTPPIINQSSYNVTSGYGNITAWRYDRGVYVNTSDSTPSVTFSLDKISNCSIGINNFNYSFMISNDSNTLCSTIDTLDMTCTLPSSQILSANNTHVYLGCISSTGFENITSSSGELHLYYDPVPSVPSLIFPIHQSLISTTSILLKYSSSDLNNDNITYYVYANKTGTNLNLVYNGTDNQTQLTGLINGETWSWLVSASDDHENSLNSSLSSFGISISTASSSGTSDGTSTLEEEQLTPCETINDRFKEAFVELLLEATKEKLSVFLNLLHDFFICHTSTIIGG